MQIKSAFLLLFFFSTGFPSFALPPQRADKLDNLSRELIPGVVFDLTRVMLNDVTDPCTASRYYAYALSGGYEVVAQSDPGAARIKQVLKDYPVIEKPAGCRNQYYPLSSLYAILEMGREMLPSGYLLQAKEAQLISSFKNEGLSGEQLNDSKKFALAIVKAILQYAAADGYNKISTYTYYQPRTLPGYWLPTPPAYFGAVGAYWNTLRPFFLDSAAEFKPVRPAPYSVDTGSVFYKLTMEVYNTVDHLTPEQKAVAAFWDCNPFAIQYDGHMMIGLKKITPGGHWMGIAGEAANKAGLNFAKAMEAQTLTAIVLNDAFISCWDEKYRSQRIRPETFINKHVDDKWRPLLQTPPFPEYSSGHATISTAAACVLTYLFGDNFSFSDSTELYFGLPVRNFNSFSQASVEAGISRLYGGIHFHDSINAGYVQGKQVADLLIEKLKAAGITPLVQY